MTIQPQQQRYPLLSPVGIDFVMIRAFVVVVVITGKVPVGQVVWAYCERNHERIWRRW